MLIRKNKMELPNINKKQIEALLSKDIRLDGRKPFDYRDIIIETDVSNNAEGSARVKIGKTDVIVGVKMGVQEPYTDHEDEGTMMTGMEYSPASGERYESGPPKINAIETARVVDRGIRESGFIDFKKLCIKKGEKVYGIFLDLYSFNDDGNLTDAFCLAAVAAILTAKMPKYDVKTEKIKYGEFLNKSLPLTKKVPLTITFHKIGDKIIVDPNIEEEETSEGRITLALTNDKEILINAAQKGKGDIFSEEEVGKIIDLAVEKFKDLEKVINKIK